MPARFRAVIDVNVIVSAFIRPSGPPGQLLKLFVSNAFDTVFTPEILDELRRTLQKPALKKYLSLSHAEIERRIFELEILGITVAGTELSPRVSRDPDDDKFISAAMVGNADYVVSGDDDLLVLKQHDDIRIISPREFLAILRTSSHGKR